MILVYTPARRLTISEQVGTRQALEIEVRKALSLDDSIRCPIGIILLEGGGDKVEILSQKETKTTEPELPDDIAKEFGEYLGRATCQPTETDTELGKKVFRYLCLLLQGKGCKH